MRGRTGWRTLVEQGVGPEQRVAVMVPRSVDWRLRLWR